MDVIVTGSAGFIGCEVALRLLARGDRVFGIDSVNDYYDPRLKQARLERLRLSDQYHHHECCISDAKALDAVFRRAQPQRVIHLAAQAGVRYSLQNPGAYVASNLVGFANVLECCRQYGIEHLVYASSSSVYGANTHLPFSENDNADHPLSLYAASKKSNELMAHAYSHLFNLPCTGLRFFTVYGPWGRPDMAYFKFVQKILAGETIELYNFGHHRRDFTYIDDVVTGVMLVFDRIARPDPAWDSANPKPAGSSAPFRLYNIGNQHPVELLDLIALIEKSLGIQARTVARPMQAGDVAETFANIDALMRDVGYRPDTPIETGVNRFVEWYRNYYGV